MNIVFLVHGIGRHAKGWSDDPVAALDQALRLYPQCFPAGKKLGDYLEIVEIRYDDIFDLVLQRWDELAQSLPAPAGAFNWTGKVSELLQRANNDGATFARFGGDVLLYGGFALVARAARLRLNAIVSATIFRAHVEAIAADRNPPKFAVVAHSMGTAVAQDALHQLATGEWVVERDEIEDALPDLVENANLSEQQAADLKAVLDGLAADETRTIPVNLTGLFLVSDTSPLLHRAPALYSELRTATGAFDCTGFWSINHELDPVSRVGAGLGGGAVRGDKVDIVVRHIHKRNIHDFAHYLSHPRVHAAIFRRMIPDFSNACFQQAQELAKRDEWKGFGGELAGLEAQARQRLIDELRNSAAAQRTVEKLRETIEKYFGLIGVA